MSNEMFCLQYFIYLFKGVESNPLCGPFGLYRLRELHTLKGHVESVVKLKGLDIETIQQHYTV